MAQAATIGEQHPHDPEQQERGHNNRHDAESRVGVEAKGQRDAGQRPIAPPSRAQRSQQTERQQNHRQRLHDQLIDDAAEGQVPARRSQQRRPNQRGPATVQVAPQKIEGQHRQHTGQRRDDAHLHHADAEEPEAQRDEIGEEGSLSLVGLSIGQVACAFQPAQRVQPVVALVGLAAVGERVQVVETDHSREDKDCSE